MLPIKGSKQEQLIRSVVIRRPAALQTHPVLRNQLVQLFVHLEHGPTALVGEEAVLLTKENRLEQLTL